MGRCRKILYRSVAQQKECPEFETIAARNGDTTYDREVIYFPYPGFGLEVCADNYKSVSVVCPDGDWDEQHPANTSLNDLVKIEYETYACFVDGKYSEDALEFERPTKLLTRLGENDLRIIQPSSNSTSRPRQRRDSN